MNYTIDQIFSMIGSLLDGNFKVTQQGIDISCCSLEYESPAGNTFFRERFDSCGHAVQPPILYGFITIGDYKVGYRNQGWINDPSDYENHVEYEFDDSITQLSEPQIDAFKSVVKKVAYDICSYDSELLIEKCESENITINDVRRLFETIIVERIFSSDNWDYQYEAVSEYEDWVSVDECDLVEDYNEGIVEYDGERFYIIDPSMCDDVDKSDFEDKKIAIKEGTPVNDFAEYTPLYLMTIIGDEVTEVIERDDLFYRCVSGDNYIDKTENMYGREDE